MCFSPLHHNIPDAQCLGKSLANNSPSVSSKDMHPNPEIIKTIHWFLQWGTHSAGIAASALELFPLPQPGSSKPSSSKGWAVKRCSGYLRLWAATIRVKCPRSSAIFCQALAERCCSSLLVTRKGSKGNIHLCFHRRRCSPLQLFSQHGAGFSTLGIYCKCQ